MFKVLLECAESSRINPRHASFLRTVPHRTKRRCEKCANYDRNPPVAHLLQILVNYGESTTGICCRASPHRTVPNEYVKSALTMVGIHQCTSNASELWRGLPVPL
ncbi:hypothetical protein JTB14_024895 [Gonioctena quinquepunctata]|nr:hypothetical protein JTB14_024895 [Gonioctena quinquepunctata]